MRFATCILVGSTLFNACAGSTKSGTSSSTGGDTMTTSGGAAAGASTGASSTRTVGGNASGGASTSASSANTVGGNASGGIAAGTSSNIDSTGGVGGVTTLTANTGGVTSGGTTSSTTSVATAGMAGNVGASSTVPICVAPYHISIVHPPNVSLGPRVGSFVVTSVSADGDTRSLTLGELGADAGTLNVSFTIEDDNLPVLDALQGRTVQVFAEVFRAMDTPMPSIKLVLSDENGLVLAVEWRMDSVSAVYEPMTTSLSDVGISITQGATVCRDSGYCQVAVHNIVFTGTTSIELPVNTQGSFQVGSTEYTAFAGGSTANGPASVAYQCRDSSPYIAWGIFRSGL